MSRTPSAPDITKPRPQQHALVRLGVCKPPIAAGRGSGGLYYDIVPGRPAQSILLFRMKATAPDIMMPELGRALIHERGVQLIAQWIEEIPGSCAESAVPGTRQKTIN